MSFPPMATETQTMMDGYFEIGGEVELDTLARGLDDALRHLRMTTGVIAGPGAVDERSIRMALHDAVKEARAFGFPILGLQGSRPFDALRPLFTACHEAGASCRAVVDGPQGRQAAYARAGGTMLWIAFLLTSSGEVRYGPSSTYQPMREGSVPGISDWLDAARALGEELPPLTQARV